jgi:transposase
LRDEHVGPELGDFFAWANARYEKVKDRKGSVRSALGDALRQREALLRPLDDGRLPLENGEASTPSARTPSVTSRITS